MFKKIIPAVLILAFTVIIPSLSLSATDIVNDGTLGADLVSCYDLDEASGETRVDATGTNDLADTNSVDADTGVIGDAADFNSGGTSDEEYLSKTSPSGVEPLTDMTVGGWFRFNTVADDRQPVTVFDSTAGTFAWRFITAGSKIQFQVYDGSTLGSITSNTTLSTDTWYHIVATWDGGASAGSRGLIYIDGSDDTNTDDTPSSMQDVSTPLVLGNRDGYPAGGFFEGDLDIVFIHDVVLSGSNISDIYNSGTGIPCEAAATPAGEEYTIFLSLIKIFTNKITA